MKFYRMIVAFLAIMCVTGCAPINKITQSILSNQIEEKNNQPTNSKEQSLTKKQQKELDNQKDKASDVKKPILKIMSVSDTFLTEIEDFEILTQCDVQVDIVDINGFTQLLNGALQNNESVPDVVVFEREDLHNKLIQPYLYDLTELASASNLKNYMVNSVFDYGHDEDGKLVGVTYQMNPVAFYYRRSLAKKVFGTDNPSDIENMLANYGSIQDMANTLSLNNIKFMPDLYGFRFFRSIVEEEWITDLGIFEIAQSKRDFLDTIKQLKADQAVAFTTEWSDDWIKGMYDKVTNEFGTDMEIFGYALPSWALQNVIMLANQSTTANQSTLDNQATEDNQMTTDSELASEPNALGIEEDSIKSYNPTQGDWAIASINQAGFLGGEYMAIIKESKNLELAKQFVDYMVADTSHLKLWSTRSHQIFAHASIEKIQSFSQEKSFLGGQDYEQAFKVSATKFNSKMEYGQRSQEILKKEAAINLIFEQLLLEFIQGDFHTVDEALRVFEERVKAIYPELFTIE